VVECTGLENRRPFTGLVSSNLTLSAICANKMGPAAGSYFDCAEQGAWTNSPEFDQIAERFGTLPRSGDGPERSEGRAAQPRAISPSPPLDKCGPASAAVIFPAGQAVGLFSAVPFPASQNQNRTEK
jgi:hypothetical protein